MQTETTGIDWQGLLQWATLPLVAAVAYLVRFAWRASRKIAEIDAALKLNADSIAKQDVEIGITRGRRESVNDRFGAMEGRLMLVEANYAGLTETFGMLDERMSRLLDRLDQANGQVNERHQDNLRAMGRLAERVAAMEAALRSCNVAFRPAHGGGDD